MNLSAGFRAMSSTTVLALLLVAVAGAAQQLAQAPLGPVPGVPAGEVERLMDAYAIMQVQGFLALDEQQFAPFLSRLRTLQQTRRRNEQARLRLLQELDRLSRGPAAQVREADLGERLRALQELETRSAADLQKAYEGVDQVLDLRQRARFRIFEEQMERRKLELLMRARAGGRPRPQRPLSRP